MGCVGFRAWELDAPEEDDDARLRKAGCQPGVSRALGLGERAYAAVTSSSTSEYSGADNALPPATPKDCLMSAKRAFSFCTSKMPGTSSALGVAPPDGCTVVPDSDVASECIRVIGVADVRT